MLKKIGCGGICLSLYIFLLAAVSFSQEVSLLVLSEIEERIAGEMAFVTMERKLTEQGLAVADDPAVTAIGRAVAQYADRPQLRYSFHVIEGNLAPQALSFPGGYVLLSRSLLTQACQTEAEVAFVLGHEIAHSALRHYADVRLEDAQQVAYVKRLIQQRNLFDAKANVSVAAELQQFLLPYMVKIRQLKEIEADQFGALYALRAGYRFSGGVNVLNHLRQRYGEKFRLEEQLLAAQAEKGRESAAHPTLSERIEQLELFRIKAVEVAKLFPLGRDALDQGNYQEAALIFDTILSLFPQSRTAHIGRGVAYHLQYWDSTPGDDFLLAYPAALEVEYLYLIERRPRDLDALQRAMEEYRLVLAAEPGNGYAQNNLGVALAEANQFAEAEKCFREALRVEQRDFSCFNLALVLRQKYLDTKQADIKHEAVALMKQYLQFTPQDQAARKYLEELEAAAR